MTSQENVKSIINSHITELRQNFGVSRIGLFGSTVRGDNQAGSDIDILVEFSRPVGFISFIRLENYLKELLNAPVDLVTPKALKPHIGRKIMAEVVYVG